MSILIVTLTCTHTHTLIQALGLRQTALEISAMTMGNCRLRWDRGKEARPRSKCCKIGIMNETSSHTHTHTATPHSHIHKHTLTHLPLTQNIRTSRFNVDIAQHTFGHKSWQTISISPFACLTISPPPSRSLPLEWPTEVELICR